MDDGDISAATAQRIVPATFPGITKLYLEFPDGKGVVSFLSRVKKAGLRIKKHSAIFWLMVGLACQSSVLMLLWGMAMGYRDSPIPDHFLALARDMFLWFAGSAALGAAFSFRMEDGRIKSWPTFFILMSIPEFVLFFAAAAEIRGNS